MTEEHHVVRRATAEDAEAITEILAISFVTDPISQWIFPVGDDERARRHPAFFRPFVDLALADGAAYTTTDLAGAALWLTVDVTAEDEGDGGEGPDVARRVAEACGEHAGRFHALDELFSANHPVEETHAYLMFVGVRPGRQNQGVGTALLCDRFVELDETKTPAYLEASSPTNRRLYARLGFDPITTLTLPDGPDLWPMWRPAG
jgi:ribosomal protein S18 acetylase RimI-like enzyme